MNIVPGYIHQTYKAIEDELSPIVKAGIIPIVLGGDHSITFFRRAMEEGLIDPEKSVQLGMRGSLYDPNEHKMAREMGFQLIPSHEMRRIGLDKMPKIIKSRVGDSPVFLTFDIEKAILTGESYLN